MNASNEWPDTPEEHLKQMATTLDMLILFNDRFREDGTCDELAVKLMAAKDIVGTKTLN